MPVDTIHSQRNQLVTGLKITWHLRLDFFILFVVVPDNAVIPNV